MSDTSSDAGQDDIKLAENFKSTNLHTEKFDVNRDEQESSALDILQFSRTDNAPAAQAPVAGGTVGYDNGDVDTGLSIHSQESSSAHPVDDVSVSSTPVPYNTTTTTPFQEWITERHLSKYTAAFDSSGYADLELLAFLTQSETERMISSTFAHCRCA